MIIDLQEQALSASFDIAIVASRFNQVVTDKLLQGALSRLAHLGFSDEQIMAVRVPGAVEIPYTIQQLLTLKKYSAIIGLGAVIKGETDHYQYVCEQVSQGWRQLVLSHNTPIIFGVLTTQTKEQAFSRAGGDKGHIGIECVNTACEMVQVRDAILGR